MAGLKTKRSVASDCAEPTKRRKNARNQGNKLRPDIICSINGVLASAKAAHCALLVKKFFYGLLSRTTLADVNRGVRVSCIQNDFSRRIQNRGVRVSCIQNDFSRCIQNRGV